ncbi:Glutathione S-transferase class-mu 28 kDa isozyme [Porphyridium purpureum]|uniref:Glutathione S-transferase class-mu 28 kDa isozyme n=1 Tax=Porphyridium purpureum TaxID=35688 RepID=A0A5J4YZF4_PORPP|nr:Glutathione S-transferase class-mu 28 kDa isozyme [Porphyridium purpureum]|eukprot:POR1674..scf209_3
MELVYIGVRARAETIRMVLRHVGMPFKDTVLTDSEGIAQAKLGAPMEKFPILILNSDAHEESPSSGAGGGAQVITLFESGAIARYIGSQTGLYPIATQPLVAAHTDGIFDVAQHLMQINTVVNVYSGNTFETEKSAVFEKINAQFPKLERIIQSSPTGFFSADKPLIGDFHMFYLLDQIILLETTFLSRTFPALYAFYKRMLVSSLGLRSYLVERARVGTVGFDKSFIRTKAVEIPYDSLIMEQH